MNVLFVCFSLLWKVYEISFVVILCVFLVYFLTAFQLPTYTTEHTVLPIGVTEPFTAASHFTPRLELCVPLLVGPIKGQF